LKERLTEKRVSAGKSPVELRLDEARAEEFISGTPAGETDFDTEFLDYISSPWASCPTWMPPSRI
jgi:glutamate-5-semialdehyde dehydrogenase